MRVSILLLFALAILIWNCSSQKVTAENHTGEQLILSSGGGVTGVYTTYIILNNCDVFKRIRADEAATRIGKLKKESCLKIFSLVKSTGLKSMNYLKPGNMSKILEYRNGDFSSKVVWAMGSSEVPAELKELYELSMGFISKL